MTSSTIAPSLVTLSSLIAHCRDAIANPTYTNPPLTADPLTLLHTAATLAKANITRLSVALRPPVTDEAAQKFLTELSASIVPTLAAAVSSCDPLAHGHVLASEVRVAVDTLLAAIAEYVNGAETGGDRLLNTGVVWSACDRLIGLRESGAAGVVAKDLGSYTEMVGDAAAELKTWIEEEDEDGSGDDDDDEDEQGFWDRPTRKGRLDEVTKEAAEKSGKTLGLVKILFGAIKKRRLEGAGKLADVGRVDGIAGIGKEISGLADELGMAFYEEEDLETVVGTLRCESLGCR